jgi:hypothetical protein
LYQPAAAFRLRQAPDGDAQTPPHRALTPGPQRHAHAVSPAWARSIREKGREDHIVFENTRYEDPTDPIFYALHRHETDGPAAGDAWVDADEEPAHETDFGALVEQYGFPGKTQYACRKRFMTGSAHERTMPLFKEPTWDGDTRPVGRRRIAPHAQGMSHTFQAAGEEVPFFRGGRRAGSPGVSVRGREGIHPVPAHFMTQRVIQPDLQDPPPALRTHVRVIQEKRADSLAPSLQGSAELEQRTRRSFFDIRR